MRYLSFAASLVTVASARNWIGVDTEWAVYPDKTADWYKQHEEPLPELAEAITTVETNKSYVVKLECVGCPFRLREIGEVIETWQKPPQDNSLLLNFTIDDRILLLDGKSIAPLAPMPLEITAFQTAANLSQYTMDKMMEMQMLDRSFNLGTKYGRFELQYEHSVVGTKQIGRIWIQLDIIGVHMTGQNPGSYTLDKEGQKMVQLLLREQIDTEGLYIEDIQVVERKDRVQPFRMDCGRLAMVRTAYNPLEWDYYGQFGTLTRSWHLLLWKTGNFFSRNGLVLIILAIVAGAVTLVRRRMAQQHKKIVADDAEALLLAPEYEQAPPEYGDVVELDDKGARA